MYLTNPPITTAFICSSNHGDLKNKHGPFVINVIVRDHGGLTLGLLYDTIIAGLPSEVRKNSKATGSAYIGSVYTTWEQLAMSVTTQ